MNTSSSERIRVRFAPSPTGPLHIGGVRTALFNYLFAKKFGGDFLLRIEDTDQARLIEGAEAYIIEALNWCGIPFDEGPGKEGTCGPYRQSERQEIYAQFAMDLVEKGDAYLAFDTPEELDHHRQDHEEKGKNFIYNWHNRNKLRNSLSLSEKEVKDLRASGHPYVIRYKTPEDELLQIEDVIRGSIETETRNLDDKVLFKSDGMPTYHLANIVDDHLMGITHVIRGEEWLPSLPLHFLLYRSFGWTAPKFAHLPLILKPEGKGKLSKRDGQKMGFPVFPLQWKTEEGQIFSGYREEGFFPEAVINILVHLGWNEGGGSEKEFYSLKELTKAFSLEHISKGGSKFDWEKAKYYQHHYMQQKSAEELADLLLPILDAQGLTLSKSYVLEVIELMKERTTFVSDFFTSGGFFFFPPTAYDEKATKKAWKEDTVQILTELTEVLESGDFTDPLALKDRVSTWIGTKGLGFGRVMQPFRLSLVGAMEGPDVFEIACVLGKEESINRIHRAIGEIPASTKGK